MLINSPCNVSYTPICALGTHVRISTDCAPHRERKNPPHRSMSLSFFFITGQLWGSNPHSCPIRRALSRDTIESSAGTIYHDMRDKSSGPIPQSHSNIVASQIEENEQGITSLASIVLHYCHKTTKSRMH